MVTITTTRAARRRMREALRRFPVRRWLPDVGDLCIFAGGALLGYVLYQLSPLLMESFSGVALMAVGVLRMLLRRPR